MVIPRTTQDTEKDILWEEAASEYQGTRNKSEALHTKKTDPRRPPKKLVLFKGYVGYICFIVVGVVWGCVPLYDYMLKKWRVSNKHLIKAVKYQFMRIRCAHITWKGLEETRLFFNQRLRPNDFTNKGPKQFPTAYL